MNFRRTHLRTKKESKLWRPLARAGLAATRTYKNTYFVCGLRSFRYYNSLKIFQSTQTSNKKKSVGCGNLHVFIVMRASPRRSDQRHSDASREQYRSASFSSRRNSSASHVPATPRRIASARISDEWDSARQSATSVSERNMNQLQYRFAKN